MRLRTPLHTPEAGDGRRAFPREMAIVFSILLVGDFAWSLKERSVQELVKVKLLALSHDAITLNLLFGALPALAGLCIGPLIGAWSDRTRMHAGGRIPFLLASALLIAASIAGLAFSESLGDLLLDVAGGRPSWRNGAVVAITAICWTIFATATIIGNALFMALINDAVPSRVIGRFFAVFRIVSLGTGALFFFYAFDNSVRDTMQPALLSIAAIYLGGFALLGWKFNKQRPGAGEAGAGSTNDHAPAPGKVVRIHKRFYVILFAAISFAAISLLPVNINCFYAKDQFGVDTAGIGGALAVTYLISIAMAFPLGWLADRVHPLHIGFVALSLYAVAMLCAWRFSTGPVSYLGWLIAHGVISGAFLTSTAALLPRLLPRSHFSQLVAVSAAATAVLGALLSAGFGAALNASGHDFRLMFLVAGVAAGVGVMLWYCSIREYRHNTMA